MEDLEHLDQAKVENQDSEEDLNLVETIEEVSVVEIEAVVEVVLAETGVGLTPEEDDKCKHDLILENVEFYKYFIEWSLSF